MDPRFTRLYQDELTHLRELGAEFAREHPKIAGRLSLEGVEVADPYVERLLEGFAFLAARVHLKLDAEQPRLIAQLLDAMYPNFLAPQPSMMVARLGVDVTDPNLAQGFRVPRDSAVLSTLPRGQDTYCEFRTAAEVTLWPLALTQVQYFSHAPELGLTRWPPARAARGGLRMRLRAGAGIEIRQLALDRLALYIAAPDDVAMRLHELLLGAPLGTLAGAPADGTASDFATRWRDERSVAQLGFGDDEALLPETLREFSGHRLLQEVAALPQRLLFFEIRDLAPRLAAVRGSELEIVVLFGRGDAGLEPLVDADSLALHCTPAINLFPKRLDRVQLGTGTWEYHVVPDRTRPMDYEVHSVQSVQGHGAGSDPVRSFKPLYHWQHGNAPGGHGWYTLRREPRRPSERQRQHGARVPSYLGEELFLSLADPGHGPYRETLRQLTVGALVTNRDLPVLLPQGAAAGDRGWRLETPGPVSSVHCLRGPTRPVSRQPSGDVAWQLIAQLTRNQVGTGDDEANAEALRELLRLHGSPGDLAWAQQADGLRRLRARPVVRRLPFPGPLSFGSGVEFELHVDEQAFHGASAFLLASAIERLLARRVSINSFTQLTLVSAQRGVLMRWPPRIGEGPLL